MNETGHFSEAEMIPSQCRRFSLAEMQLATGDFPDARVIGRGGFGTVYEGHIDNGSLIVAIKRLASNSNQGEREFVREMETLTRLRHRNLVSLIGYCNEQDEKILVYEFMANGTLADHLYKLSRNGGGGSSLTWNQRLKICIGAGRGLDYLHSGSSIIHRDVKSTNILLDVNFAAKVSDFGLAKDISAESHVSASLKGSFGYFDPSYFTTGRLTMASDTYAFGVVLLEVLSGRAAVDHGLAEDEESLTLWAQERIRNGRVDQIVDSDLRGEISEDCLNTFVEVAKSCLRHDPKERLTMSRVVAQLEFALEQHERKGLTHKSQFWPFGVFCNGASSGILGPVTSPGCVDFGISSKQLFAISKEHDLSLLQRNGGVKGLAEKLKSNQDNGVPGDETDLINRKQAFGSNTYPRKKGRSFWRFVWDACRRILIILMIAATGSLVLGIMTEGIKEGWYEGGGIALAVLLLIICTAVSDYKQSLQFQKLKEEKQNIHMEVIRSGRRLTVSIFEIVVGDVVPLKTGDQVPADGLVISGHALSMDESSMTGESKIVPKDPVRSPHLMSGCKVADGYGTMLVTSVGMNTEWGLLMATISKDYDEETPLQVHLNGLASIIGLAGLAVAFVVLIVLLVRFFTGHTKDPNGQVQFIAGKTKVGYTIHGIVKIFTVAVTTVVVGVPECLPLLAVTLMLAYSMPKMMADKALMRKLSACETMGSATTICSDKTGTLTLNQMVVVEAYACGMKIDPPDNKSLLPSTVVSLLIESIAQNTTGSVFVTEGGGALEISGSPTDKAILQWGVNLGMDFHSIRSSSAIIHASPFTSEKKLGGVALKSSDSEVRVFWKGAAEIVLASCTGYIDRDDHVVPLDENKVLWFNKAIEDMCALSLRCVAIAYRSCKIESEEALQNCNLPHSDLVLLAILGIKDPCRPGVKNAVQRCTSAGVKVLMVTGDNLHTARAIALECGIIDSDATEPNIIEGKTFRSLTEVQRVEVAEKISVMGRSSPNDKLLLVQALRRRGHVVAVTGDGTNDAPALHEADIGLSMGIHGTEVAKESSDIIILDDNFASVVKVVRWGRSVYANIQKFTQFQLTIIVAALIINVVAAVFSGNVPLNAMQFVWIHLIMDTLGALALATELPTDHLMCRPPVRRREPIMTNIMRRNVLIQVCYQVTVLLIINFWGKDILNIKNDTSGHASRVNNTLVFNTFVFCQVFNKFNVRKSDEVNVWKGVTRNHLFMGIVGLEVVLQVILISFLGKFTSTVRLSWKLWLLSVGVGSISWPLAAIGKFIPVPEKPFAPAFSKKIEDLVIGLQEQPSTSSKTNSSDGSGGSKIFYSARNFFSGGLSS